MTITPPRRPARIKPPHGNRPRLLGFLFALAACGPAAAGQNTPQDLAGPAFSDPAVTVEMPENWQRQPLDYAPWAKGADLAVTLDQHLYPVFLPLIRNFAKSHGVNIAVQEGTCGISAGALFKRQADIGGFCCPPGPSDRLPGLRFHTVGIAALALLVNRDNPVAGVTTEQARRLFEGRIYHWSELSATRAAPLGDPLVRPVARLHCKNRPGHWRLLLDNGDLFGQRVAEVSNIRDMMRRVAEERAAVGYEVLWNIDKYKVGDEVKTLKVDGYAPQDDEALAAGKYPFYRTYEITTWQTPPADKPLADKLVSYLIDSLAGMVNRFGIVPAATLRAAGWRFRDDELVGGPR